MLYRTVNNKAPNLRPLHLTWLRKNSDMKEDTMIIFPTCDNFIAIRDHKLMPQ